MAKKPGSQPPRIMRQNAVSCETSKDGFEHGGSENRFAHTVPRPVTTKRIERHCRSAASNPPRTVYFRKNTRVRRKLCALVLQSPYLISNQATAGQEDIRGGAHRDQRSAPVSYIKEKEPSLMKRFDPARLLFSIWLQINTGGKCNPRAKMMLSGL